MKKLLLGSVVLAAMIVGSAKAADLPLKVPAYAPPPLAASWSWTGFYLGVQGGAGWGTEERSSTALECSPVQCVLPFGIPPNESSFTLNGWHGGGTAGFNWQLGPIVFGAEGEISGANISGKADCTALFRNLFGFTSSSTCHTNLPVFGTVTGRLGVAVDHALFYVKAGGAGAHLNHNINTVPFSGSTGDNRWGFTAGTGIEYAFWGNWSAKLEYEFMDFGTKNIVFAVQTPGEAFNIFMDDRERIHVVKAGLNYRFSWGEAAAPVMARY
jgi:outer membrane immunogenic protein